MDTIWQCAFGVDADSQNREDDDYFNKCEKAFRDYEKPDFLAACCRNSNSNYLTFKIKQIKVVILNKFRLFS